MKSRLTVIILSLCLVSLNVTAQEQIHKRKEKSKIQEFLMKAAGNRYEASQKKSSADLITEFEIKFWTGTDWTFGSSTEFNYQEEKLISKVTRANQGDEWTIINKKENTYSSGLIASEIYFIYYNESEELVPDTRILYSYDNSVTPPVLIGVLYQNWSEGSWEASEKTEYFFAGGILTGGSYSFWDGNGWIQFEKYTLEEINDTTMITYQRWNSVEWINFQREFYPGKSIAELYEYFNSKDIYDEVALFFGDYDYPDFQNQVWENDITGWVDIERQQTVIETENGSGATDKKIIKYEYWHGEEWRTEEIITYYYNGNAQPDSAIQSFQNLFEEQGWQPYLSEHYNYKSGPASLYDEVVVKFNFGDGLKNFVKFKFIWSGNNTGSEEPDEQVQAFVMKPAYPNPFNPGTNISYTMAKPGMVSIRVYDVLGRFIATLEEGMKSAGDHLVWFNAAGLSSGKYIIRMESREFSKSQIVTLVK